MSKYPADLLYLIASLKKLPGVGTKTAERFAFSLLDWPKAQLEDLGNLLTVIQEKIKHCPECHCLTENEQCLFCSSHTRDKQQICVISSPRDAYVVEETRTFKGLYHVIGGLLSPMAGKLPEHLHLEGLKKRIVANAAKEVIIALDSTIEGDATALYLKEQLSQWDIAVSRLAFGLPMGSSLEYVDGSTLAKALSGRQAF